MNALAEISSDRFPTSIETEDEGLRSGIISALKTVYDPEIPVDIYELGLIYRVWIDGPHIHVGMSLTSPMCPVAGEMPGMVERALSAMDGVEKVSVELLWEPPWNPDMMSDDAKLYLDF